MEEQGVAGLEFAVDEFVALDGHFDALGVGAPLLAGYQALLLGGWG